MTDLSERSRFTATADALAIINRGDRPLGLFVFAKARAFIDQLNEQTHAGGVVA